MNFNESICQDLLKVQPCAIEQKEVKQDMGAGMECDSDSDTFYSCGGSRGGSISESGVSEESKLDDNKESQPGLGIYDTASHEFFMEGYEFTVPTSLWHKQHNNDLEEL